MRGSQDNTMGSVSSDEKQLFALHLLRGIAAILVMLLHLHGYLTDEPNLVPSAYLAVDLFFILSGYVLSYAYDQTLRKKGGNRSFLVARVIRLAPLYLLSLLIAALVVWCSVMNHGLASISRLSVLETFAFSSLLLPTPPSLSMFPDILFPENGPAWSLFFELLINLAYAFVGPRLGRRGLLLVLAASGAMLIAAAFTYGRLEGGATWAICPVAIPRVVFSFSLGVYLCRFCKRPALGSIWAPWLITVLTIAILAWEPGDILRPYYDLTVIMILWPALLLYSANLRFGQAWTAFSRTLGDASYGLYVLHTPILNFLVALTEWITKHHWSGHGLSFVGESIAALTVIAIALSSAYDRPMRRVMRRWASPGFRLSEA